MIHSSKSSIRSNAGKNPQPVIESLEERQLLSANLLTPAISANFTTADLAATSASVASSSTNNTSVYGTNVTLTATITGTNLTGTVSFFDGTTNLGLGSLASPGVYTFNISSLGASEHSITAVYNGDSSNAASDPSEPLSQIVTAKPLTVTGITVADRTYDATTISPTPVTTGASLSGIVAGDLNNVTLVKTNVSGAFANANAGSNKTVTISGLSLSGSAAANYTLAAPTVTASITPKALTTTVTISNKTYDTTNTATIGSIGTLTGVIPADSDNVSLVQTNPAATFADANAGTLKPVTVTGLSLSGSAAGNYTLTAPAPTATITPLAITLSGITANNKIYDGTTTASLDFSNATLSGLFVSDDANLSLSTGAAVANFANKNVGTATAVTVTGITLSGTAAGNYSITQPSLTANITPKALTLTGITASNKTYDGTLTATLNTSHAALSGLISADTHSITLVKTDVHGSFSDANAGNDKSVIISGYSISGTAAANYTFTNPTTVTANITPKALKVTGVTAANKVYDGTTTATLNASNPALSGILTPDLANVSISGATANFSSANVGSGIKVNAVITLSGSAAANYTVTAPSLSAKITAAPLTITGVTVNGKVYDGTTVATLNTSLAALSGLVAADLGAVFLNVSNASATFISKNAGVVAAIVKGITLSGTDAKNYTLTQPSGLTATITQKTVTVSGLNGVDKTYDGTNSATIHNSGLILTGVLSSDKSSAVLTNGGHAITSNTIFTGTYADANVGSAKTITLTGLSLSGSNSGNYQLVTPTTAANITAKNLTVTGITANKTYDATTTVENVSTTNAALVGIVPADDSNVTIDADLASVGNFTSANAGTYQLSVTDVALTGSAAANYTLTQPTISATISPAAITITEITASNKTYNGKTNATIDTSGASLGGVETADLANLGIDTSAALGTFSDANAATAKTVTITGITLTGAAAANYTINPITTTANITPKAITITGVTAASTKVYDGTTSDPVSTSGAIVSGILAADLSHVTLNAATGTFADANVGTGKTVTINISLSGTDAQNYTVTPITSTTANITPAALTVSGITADKTYDGTTAATLDFTNAEFAGAVESDLANLSLTATSATYATANAGTGIVITPVGLTLTGSAASNYTLTTPTITGTIDQLALTASGINADKVYDGTTAATLDFTNANLSGVLNSDDVSLTYTSASFASANAGNGLVVTPVGLTLTGSAASNYTLTPPTITATITAAPLTLTGVTATDKTYDGTTDATLDTTNAHLSGIVDADTDNVSLAGNTGTFESANAGTGISVTPTGLSLTGSAASNYTLVPPTLTANITPIALTVTGITADKTYDGTTAATLDTTNAHLSGVLEADTDNVSLTGNTGTFASADAGTGIVVTPTDLALTGSAASNYTLTPPTITATITPIALTVTGIIANNKIVDGTTNCVISVESPQLSGVLEADLENVSLDTTNVQGNFSQTTVGNNLPVTVTGLALTGSAATNYTITEPSLTASIFNEP